LALLHDPAAGSPTDKQRDVGYDHQICKQHLLGYAYHLRGDANRATDAIREALAMVRGFKPPTGADERQFAEDIKEWIKILETALRQYTEKAASPPDDRR
jgi:hypothetical protein